MATPDFKKIVESAGIPTTEDAWKELFKQDVEAEGSIINNDSPYSPFWRLITAIIIKPVVWIINRVLIAKILPNLFLMTADDDAFIETKAWEHNLNRKAESKLLGKIRFNRAAGSGPGLLIPAGTVIQTDPINGTVYRVITLDDSILPTNAPSVLVQVQAEQPGAAYNLAGGYFHILPQAVQGIGSVVNDSDWIDEPGADKESNEELKQRTRNAFTAAAPWHIDAVYRAMLTERAGINADNVFFEHDAPRGPGTANAYILLDTGEPSPTMLQDLNQYVMDKGFHGHGDDLQVMAMPGVEHDIGLTVYPQPELLESEVTAMLSSIDNFIRCAFRENSDYSDKATRTEPASRFSFSRLGQELHREFAGIESLEWQQLDIQSAMNVPRIGTLTIDNGAAT